MKISLALAPRRNLSRQTAWGCLTSNVAFAGVGSLAAGRRSGYAQLAMVVVGMGLTLAYFPRFVIWYRTNGAQVFGPEVDPAESLREFWLALRPTFLAMSLYALGWLWGVATGLAIVREAKEAERAGPPRTNEPPKLF